MSKSIAVYGSTGTIGENTLHLIRKHPDLFHAEVLVAGKNIDRIRDQIREFKPRYVAVESAENADKLGREFPGLEVGHGEAGLRMGVERSSVELVVMGIVGFTALAPTIAAARAGKTIALANKESLVVAGPLVIAEAKKHNARILPVDSEHNALFQLLEGRPRQDIATLVLTASGGPLLRKPEIPLDDVTPALAIAHPNWKMGPKISVDSATLMNKGLELIEAAILFDFKSTEIEVWVHPQSIVHGAIWLKDNSCLAQLSKPDMKSSIGYAMHYPTRLPAPIPKLTLKEMSQLEFMEPDTKRFPCLDLARQALDSGPSHLVALNAANEIAVARFLDGKLLFSQIPRVIEEALGRHRAQSLDSLDRIFSIDRETRELAEGLFRN